MCRVCENGGRRLPLAYTRPERRVPAPRSAPAVPLHRETPVTDADPTPDAPAEEHARPKITDRTVSEVVERTRDVIRKTREMLESSRDLLDRVRHRDGESKADDAPGEHNADESSGRSEASDARPVDGRA
jgi:hypothetical protein